MGLSIEDAIAKVPFLKGEQDIVVTKLDGGITNMNYRLDAGGKSFVLRITGDKTDMLGIVRQAEYQANMCAGKLGLAPEVLYFIEPEGYLVTRFLNGRHISPQEMAQETNIRQVARKLRNFHRLAPELSAEFNVFRRIELLTKISREHSSSFPTDFDWLMQKAAQVEQALMVHPYIPTPCHCDLLNLNFLKVDVPGEIPEICILDWEYAGQGDIFFDLANFSHHHLLNETQVECLLQEYFGEWTSEHFARLKLMWPMSEIHEAMWGTTQSSISKLDEDFLGYANLWFSRAREALTDFRLEQWLRQVSKRS